jgi:hypothetical protein
MNAVSNLANLVVDRFQLVPPVDIRELVHNLADLEFCVWPWDCDGVAILNVSPSKVFIKDGQPRRRERFTLAHELGHVLIPWHVNVLDCKPAETQEIASDEGYLGIRYEVEANDFASRVLIPDGFIEEFTRTYPHPVSVLEKLEQADVSAAAGVLALRRVLLPGYVFTTPDLKRPVRSEGTDYTTGPAHLRRLCIDSGTVEHQGRPVTWYQLAQAVEPSAEIASSAAAKAVLRQLAESAAGMETGLSLQAIQQSVAGVIGAAKNVVAGLKPAVVMGVLVYRFSKKAELAALTQTPEFHDYLSFKARSLADR